MALSGLLPATSLQSRNRAHSISRRSMSPRTLDRRGRCWRCPLAAPLLNIRTPNWTTTRCLIARAARRLPDELTLLTAIGAPNVRHVIDLGKCALDRGSEALLLPMPMFFRYQQRDLAGYCRDVAQALAAPCLV